MLGCPLRLLCRRAFVDEVDNTHVGDARVRLETNLTGTTVAVAHLDMVRLNLRAELAQAVFVQLRECETTVASEAAAAYTLRQEYLRGA